MNKKIRNILIYIGFLCFLLIFIKTPFFGWNIFWPKETNVNVGFNGIIFNNPKEISDMEVKRSTVIENYKDLVKYNISFNYTGKDSDLRILGTPNRQIFFPEGINPKKSIVMIKGDFDKINDKLFNEKFKLKNLYKKSKEYKFIPNSQIKVPIKNGKYDITIYYSPKKLIYRGIEEISESSAFISNAKINKFTDEKKSNYTESSTFNNSGYYVNYQEIFNKSAISKLSITKTINTVLFLLSLICALIFIWLNKEFLNKFYPIIFMINISTIYKFLDIDTATLGIILIYPILEYIGGILGLIMKRDKLIIKKEDFKYSLFYSIVFFIISLIIFVIPRAIM